MSRPGWTPAYIGLGSNLADPAAQLVRAVREIAELPRSRCVAVSDFVTSAPLGPADQPDYVNAAAALLTQLSAMELLAECQDIEARHLRCRDGVRWGPRTLDLDILVFGSEQIRTAALTVPHPELPHRAFVLGPLLQIAPGLRIPGLGPLQQLAAACDPGAVAPLGTADGVA